MAPSENEFDTPDLVYNSLNLKRTENNHLKAKFERGPKCEGIDQSEVDLLFAFLMCGGGSNLEIQRKNYYVSVLENKKTRVMSN